MTDRDKAIELLRAVEAERQDTGLYVLPYTGIGVDLSNPEEEPDTIRITMPISEVARLEALLSPLTVQMVDDVILQALDDWHSCLGWDEMERYAFAGHVMARLRQQMGGGHGGR